MQYQTLDIHLYQIIHIKYQQQVYLRYTLVPDHSYPIPDHRYAPAPDHSYPIPEKYKAGFPRYFFHSEGYNFRISGKIISVFQVK